MAEAEKKPLSIAETIAVYEGMEELPEIKITEEQKKELIAFFKEHRETLFEEEK